MRIKTFTHTGPPPVVESSTPGDFKQVYDLFQMQMETMRSQIAVLTQVLTKFVFIPAGSKITVDEVKHEI